MNEDRTANGVSGDDHRARVLWARIRARMLHALREGWEPFPDPAEAYVHLEEMVRRVDESPAAIESDPTSRRFYAALAADPELAETFWDLASAADAPVPLTLTTRLAALGEFAPSTWQRIRNLAVALQNAAPGMGSPAPAFARGRQSEADDAGGVAVRYFPGPEEGLAVAVVLLPVSEDRVQLELRLVRRTAGGRYAPADRAWTPIVTLRGAPLAGTINEHGTWAATELVPRADLTRVDVDAEFGRLG